MIDKSKLQIIQLNFLYKKNEILIKEEELEQLRLEFIDKFPPDKILSLKLDQYVYGYGRRDTFCYLLEEKLKELGSISLGGSKKFGIYQSSSGEFITSEVAYGKNSDDAFRRVKEDINNLIDAGQKDDIEALRDNPITPMFKGKILATYFPEKYLSVFSDRYLNHYLKELKLNYAEDAVEVDKRVLLMEFKEKDEIMEEWSNYEYMRFLWDMFPLESAMEEKIIQAEEFTFELFEDEITDLLMDIPSEVKNRKEISISVIQRNATLVRKLKELYSGNCQICDFTFTKESGDNYSECHHLIPLGEEGSDSLDNVILVCANCHKMLHYTKVEFKKLANNSRDILINGKHKSIKYHPKHFEMLN